MSRRESRNSTGGRASTGTGSLEEFENFKKKYLLVNKHIAKLNSSLNVRVEELMSQIKLLNMEILGLRSSEMTLRKQLKEEQTKSRDIYMQAEIAARMLISQINALKLSCGYDKAMPPSPVKFHNGRPKATRPRQQRPQPRLSQAPEYEAIVEVSDDDATPTKFSHRRDVREAPSPSPSQLPNSTNYATPVRRRRSTGSTANSTPTPNSNPMCGPNVSSEHGRRSSDPTSMEISSGAISSPLTPCPPSFSATSESAVPTPTSSAKVNPPEASQTPVIVEKSSLSSLPHMSLLGMGLKRLSRRPSGLIMSQVPADLDAKKDANESKVPKDGKTAKNSKENSKVDVPAVSVITVPSVAATASYPTPVSAKPSSSDAPTPSTPPRGRGLSLAVPRSISPITPTRSIPMSPNLSANPALSPPPARKPSLTRMQLDFGIKPADVEDSDDGEADGDGDMNGNDGDSEDLDEGNTVETTATRLIDFKHDRSISINNDNAKRGAKRKTMEDDTEEITRPPEANVSQRSLPSRKRDRSERRDTGTVLNATEIKERASKDSLRDVTNEKHSSPKFSNVTDSPSMKDKPKTSNSGESQDDPFNAEDPHRKAALKSIAGITAKLERIASNARPRPLPPNVNLPPPPSRNNPVISLQETLESLRVDRAERMDQEANGDAKAGSESDTAPNELGRRNSGRQRKSVNYKEPSLVAKMRKPDTGAQPPSSSNPSGIASRVEALSALAPHPTAPISVPKPAKRKKGNVSLTDDPKAATSTSLSTLASLRGDAQGHQDENAIEKDQGTQGTRAVRLALRDKLKEDVNGQDDDDNDDDEDEFVPNSGSYSSSAPLSSRFSFGTLGTRDRDRDTYKTAPSLTGSSLPSLPAESSSSAFLGPRLTGPLGMRPVPGAARERVREREMGGPRRDRDRAKERDRDIEKEREAESASIAT